MSVREKRSINTITVTSRKTTVIDTVIANASPVKHTMQRHDPQLRIGPSMPIILQMCAPKHATFDSGRF